MALYYKLTAPLYWKSDVLRLSCVYSKEAKGYVAFIEAVELRDNDPCLMFSKMFCSEYFQIGDGRKMLVESSRRNQKREEKAEEMLLEQADELVSWYLVKIGRTDLGWTKLERKSV